MVSVPLNLFKNIFVNPLRITYMHTIYLDHTHSHFSFYLLLDLPHICIPTLCPEFLYITLESVSTPIQTWVPHTYSQVWDIFDCGFILSLPSFYPVPPTIKSSDLPEKTVVRYKPITLQCIANGIPNPSITWLKDEQPVNTAQGNLRVSIRP